VVEVRHARVVARPIEVSPPQRPGFKASGRLASSDRCPKVIVGCWPPPVAAIGYAVDDGGTTLADFDFAAEDRVPHALGQAATIVEPPAAADARAHGVNLKWVPDDVSVVK
jgi:hypothetical protein